MRSREISREELYEQVWSTPMRKLAPTFGLSDVALTKMCHRFAIPTPGRGYWARLAAGKRDRKPPLPPPSPEVASARIFVGPVKAPSPPSTAGPKPAVHVPRDLKGAHESIRSLGRTLPSAEVDEHGRLVIKANAVETFAVTLEHHHRALRLLDGVAQAILARGHQVMFRSEPSGSGVRGSLVAILSGQTVSLSMIETLDRSEHRLTAEEKERAAKGFSYGIPKYDYAPAGSLRLSLPEARIGRSSWADTEAHRLEEHLRAVVLAVESEAGRRLALAEEEERRRQEAEVRRLQQEEETRRARAREAHVRQMASLEEDLRTMTAHWALASQIDAFLTAVEESSPEGSGEATAAWLSWARGYVRRLNPLSSPGSIVKPVPRPPT